MKTLAEFEAAWVDAEAFHKQAYESFEALVNADPRLKEHRDYIEQHAYGFGARPHHWMWRLLAEDVVKNHPLNNDATGGAFPDTCYSFLEIGVYRGQVLSLVDMLWSGLPRRIVGVSTYDGLGDHASTYTQDHPYHEDVTALFKEFNHRKPYMLQGNSTDPVVVSNSKAIGPYHLLFVDGGHDSETVRADLMNYAPMVVEGGYLVCDDAACNLKMPWGFFCGHRSVSDVVDELLPPLGSKGIPGCEFKHVGSLNHNRLFRRIS